MIPKTFTIFGLEYKVIFVDKIDAEESCGECLPMKNEIHILSSLPESIKEQTYYHELIHCILTNLSYPKLNLDEKLVDRVAMALHQITKTSKY